MLRYWWWMSWLGDRTAESGGGWAVGERREPPHFLEGLVARDPGDVELEEVVD